MIDILVPVLNRPQNAGPLVDSVLKNTRVPWRLLFLCSQGDEEEINACDRAGGEVVVMDFPAGRSDYPKKMNEGFRRTSGEFLLLGADDISVERGWDEIALQHAERTNASVIGTYDGSNRQVMKGNFSTHPLVRRRYVTEQGASLDGPGILISEAYDHNYCDRELCHLAQYRRQWVFAAGSKILHHHPMRGRTAQDDTYRKGLSTMFEDQRVFWRRSEQWGRLGLLGAELSAARRDERRSR